MNSKQKLILLLLVLATAVMMLFPPFQLTISGTEMNMGYRFLFDPPKRGSLTAFVNVPVLFAQWVAAILVGMLSWFLVQGKTDYAQTRPIERNPENKSFFENITFGLLRLIRGIVGFFFGWQFIGLLPVLTWFSDPAAVTGKMVEMVVFKIVMIVIFGFSFFGLRKLIHWLHSHWFGLPHPSLKKALAL